MSRKPYGCDLAAQCGQHVGARLTSQTAAVSGALTRICDVVSLFSLQAEEKTTENLIVQAKLTDLRFCISSLMCTLNRN